MIKYGPYIHNMLPFENFVQSFCRLLITLINLKPPTAIGKHLLMPNIINS